MSMNDEAKQAIARATYSLELGRGDLDDLLRELRQELRDTALAECIDIHLTDAIAWIQEVGQAEDIDIVELMEAFMPANDSNRDERELLLRNQRHQRFARELAARLPAGLEVDVTEWAGCDEDWSDPVYIIVEEDDPGEEREYYDATCDLGSDEDPEERLSWVIQDIING